MTKAVSPMIDTHAGYNAGEYARNDYGMRADAALKNRIGAGGLLPLLINWILTSYS